MVAYEKMDDDMAAKYREADNLRKFAFFGIALSTVATLVCVISVPMVYNYMQHVQSMMQNEVDFCKSRSGSLWSEVTRTQMMKGSDRTKRQADAGYAGESTGVNGGSKIQGGGGCCGCGTGNPGPQGPPGPDGKDGTDGAPGTDGGAGKDGTSGSNFTT